MNVKQIVDLFVENPDRMSMGSGKLSKRWNCSQADIYLAREKARAILASTKNERFERALEKLRSNPVKRHFEVEKKVDAPEPYTGGNPKNVLVIGDPHEPFCKDGYLEFCREMQEKYDCGTVIHIGDCVDNHAISYHEKDVSGMSAGDEFNLAKQKMKRWYYTFPEVRVCIGNHDALPFRKIFTAGLPKEWLKSYEELLEAPKTWKWDFVHQHEGVIYQHGTGLSGEMASINAARENRQSTVIGHLHTVCNTRFLASYKDVIFGASVGCGIDHKAYAFCYGRENTRKPVLACCVVLDGKTPINLLMPL